MKSIYIILLAMFTCGCYNDKPTIIKDPEKRTTVEVLNNIDSMQVSIVRHKCYIMKDSLVKYQFVSIDADSEPVKMGLIVLFPIVAFVIGLLIGIIKY